MATVKKSGSYLNATERLMLLAMIVGGLVFTCRAAPDPAAATPEVVTNLAALSQLASEDKSLVVSMRIEGTVWWSNLADGRVILNDNTAVVQLELDLPCQMPALGDRLILEGACLAVKTSDAIKLSGVPVVDCDGIHTLEVKSGSIYLKAGRHAVRVVWLDRIRSFGLDVSYEGPDLPRQKIPDTALFRIQTDAATGTTNVVPGLDYLCYEGQWWRHFPTFDHMRAVKTGVVDNFDIDVRSRDSHVGLQFIGFIEVPMDGEYTFNLKSDDGSRLFIGDPSLRVLKAGSTVLPSPNPVPMEEIEAEYPEFKWTAIEGMVRAFHRLDGVLEVDLMTQTGLVRLTVAEDSESSFTLRPQNRIRAVGVSRKIRNLDGAWICGDFFVQNWDRIELLYVNPQIWAEYPLVEIGDLMTTELSSGDEFVVHLRGRIVSAGAGTSLVLEDGSGRIVLDGGAPDTRVGQSSDVLGQVTREDSNLVLRNPLIRQMGEGETESNRLPLLTTAEQICQLSLEEAVRGYPVRVRGVITSLTENDGAVFQDSSRGIYMLAEAAIPLQIGDYCEVEGVTVPFAFQPYIEVSRLQKLGPGMLPDPAQPTWDQLINGSMHCNYVELEGVVASFKGGAVELLTRDGRIKVQLNSIGPDMPMGSLGATVRLSGCLFSEWDGESHQVVVGSIYLDQQNVTVIRQAPIDPFSSALKRVGDLLQFDSQAGALQRVRVSGQLIYQDAEMSYLMDGENGLRFIPVETAGTQIGDRLDVVGFVDLNGPAALLRDAVVRRIGGAGLPIPRRLKADELVRNEYDSSLVQVDGVLLGVSSRPDGIVLEMQSGLRRFMAMLDDPTGLDEPPKIGSHLELTGVYVGQGGNRVLGRPIDSFQLLLNSGRDVHVLSRPPWWTLKRLLLVVGLLFGVLLVALVWINLLHRQVEERTQLLGDQIRQRQRVERKRAIERERTRLAHDLHDDLGSGLTEVNLLALLATNSKIPAEEKVRCADEMNKLLSRMVLSLDEIVWAENPKNDTIPSLAGYFSAHAQRLLGMASVSCGLDVAEDLPDDSLDPKFRQELFLAFKESITNVVKHANAKKVWLRISIQEDDLIVIVADDGCGIMPTGDIVGSDGLANMRDRMSALGGHCEIQNDPGKGTTVCLQAPIQRVEA